MLKGLLTVLMLAGIVVAAPAPAPRRLTLQEAEAMAMSQHPALQSATALQRAALEVPKEVRSQLMPRVSMSMTAAGMTSEEARLFAGGLNSPSVYNRLASSATVSQLISDFGRTRNLAASADLRAQAQAEFSSTTRAQVLLQVDRSYYAALRAQRVLQVARATVEARSLVADQAKALQESKLRSALDVTFARVNLEEARLLLSNAENEERSALADLANAIGVSVQESYELVEDPVPGSLATKVDGLIDEALKNRPELRQARLEAEAAAKLARAEKALRYPTVSAIANAGVATLHTDRFQGDWAAAGINMDIPIFNGGLFAARRGEAEARTEAALQLARDAENRVARDVRVAYLAAVNAYQRLQLTAQLLQQSEESLSLAQARYQLGLSSIVELTQAQLNVTRAQIAQVSAKFDYQGQRALLAFQTGDLK
ncbi:MAG TPA: TolC family protein [Paludibaculum sp.]|jgi:outer membrane protein